MLYVPYLVLMNSICVLLSGCLNTLLELYFLIRHQVSVRPVAEWGQNNVQDLTPPFLAMLPTLFALSNASAFPTTLAAEVSSPSLIVAIEHDSVQENSDWKSQTMSRGIQVRIKDVSGHLKSDVLKRTSYP